MAAPQIPNLLSLRGRSAVRGRGRGRGHGGLNHDPDAEETPEEAARRKDRVIQLTDQDAYLSRLSAVMAGYLDDPYAQLFGPPAAVQRRMPIINRGTYARTTAIDRLVTSFVTSTPGPKQIISLGAGTDTRYFRFAAAGLLGQTMYIEYDFAQNTKAKLTHILNKPQLRTLAERNVATAAHTSVNASSQWHNEDSLHYPNYALLPCDLRDFAKASDGSSSLPPRPQQHNNGPIPTLILSECCLCYLPATIIPLILTHLFDIHSPSSSVGLVFYEPIKPSDSFGRVMSSNLAARGISMPTLETFPSLEAQKARFAEYGLRDGAGAMDVEFAMQRWVSEREQERVDRCELLDEVEEWQLLAQHYCVSWGWGYGDKAEGEDVWKGWRELKSQV